MRYCSEACSRAHWRAHKAECRRLQVAAALQQQGNGLLASQPPLVWAALAVVAGAVLAYVAYRVVLVLFAKRYKVPAKGGAVLITGGCGWEDVGLG